MAPPRTVPLTTRVLVLGYYLWIPAVWTAVALPWFAYDYAESGLLTAFRDCVDVPAEVLRSRYVSESRGKYGRSWTGYHVTARFDYGGASWYAMGDVAQVPLDGKVRARVPVHRPDLAVAFIGEGPHLRHSWFMTGLSAILGFVGLVWMSVHAVSISKRLGHDDLVRARVLAQRSSKSWVYVKVAYPTARGQVSVELQVDKRTAQRMLAEPAPFLITRRDTGGDALALATFRGLRWDESRNTFAPAPWLQVALRVLPALVLAWAVVQAVLNSYQLPPSIDAAIRTYGGLWR